MEKILNQFRGRNLKASWLFPKESIKGYDYLKGVEVELEKRGRATWDYIQLESRIVCTVVCFITTSGKGQVNFTGNDFYAAYMVEVSAFGEKPLPKEFEEMVAEAEETQLKEPALRNNRQVQA